jgi:hypothetical protein
MTFMPWDARSLTGDNLHIFRGLYNGPRDAVRSSVDARQCPVTHESRVIEQAGKASHVGSSGDCMHTHRYRAVGGDHRVAARGQFVSLAPAPVTGMRPGCDIKLGSSRLVRLRTSGSSSCCLARIS